MLFPYHCSYRHLYFWTVFQWLLAKNTNVVTVLESNFMLYGLVKMKYHYHVPCMYFYSFFFFLSLFIVRWTISIKATEVLGRMFIVSTDSEYKNAKEKHFSSLHLSILLFLFNRKIFKVLIKKLEIFFPILTFSIQF